MPDATATTRTQPQADAQWRAEAIERLRQLEERIAARNADLTDEEAIELADQISHEIVDDMAARGEISFERDRR